MSKYRINVLMIGCMAESIDKFLCLELKISFCLTHPTGNGKKQDKDMHIESNRVQFNGTRVVPSGEALRTSEAIKREEDY